MLLHQVGSRQFRVLTPQSGIVVIRRHDDQATLLVPWLVHSPQQWVGVGIDGELGEAEGVALLLLPCPPNAGHREGHAVGHADPPSFGLAALVTGFEETGHWHQAKMPLLPGVAVGRLFTHRLGPGVHRGVVLVARLHLPLQHHPIAGDQRQPPSVSLDQDRGLIVLSHLLLPVVSKVINPEVFHQHRLGGRDVVDAHAQPLHRMRAQAHQVGLCQA